MSILDDADPRSESASDHRRLREAVVCFRDAWQAALTDDSGTDPPCIESHLARNSAIDRVVLLRELLAADLDYRRRRGELPVRSEYEQRFADYCELIVQVFDETVDSQAGMYVASDTLGKNPSPEADGQAKSSAEQIPRVIGRYQVLGLIDSGSFGKVYKAHDPQIDRVVAIKVPHRHRISSQKDLNNYVREAQILGRLEHPHIVPVYDAGMMADGRCFVVSKWIDGGNLATLMKDRRLGFEQAARIVAKVASALQVAERQKITHRDIKPANILIDSAGEPFVADFGLALYDELERDARVGGMTPAYASPEQARGEGHLVDGRSDIFSLGIIFYELLCGERPFRGKTSGDVLNHIKTVEPRPPRQLNHSIPKELERICLKALEKRRSDRYSTAFDLANDLQLFLQEPAARQRAVRPVRMFVSYRREDALDFVGRLCDRLATRYGGDAVHVDVVSLRHGFDIRRQIDECLRHSDVLLAVIGPDWYGSTSRGTRFLDDEHDLVRLEIESALAGGCPLVPVLVDDTPMPAPNDLPDSLRQLANLRGCRIDSGRAFERQIQQLFDSVDAMGRLHPATTSAPPVWTIPAESSSAAKVVPKGLRSFDEADASFFRQLLSGPFDRDGLPQSIRFWKTRIEEVDPDETFRVGLIYGPSGCGKSSLVRAGLLPCLAAHIQPLYIESTADETEARWLRLLQRHLQRFPTELGLVGAISELRRGKQTDRKYLIVLDQFEQWLHAHRGEDNTILAQALRQCDGQHVQAILMVRDEYWMPATRFFEQLEILPLPGKNAAGVDLFDPLHARRVLAQFGCAYGRLPKFPALPSDEQDAFLDRVISDLTDKDGKIISIQLALFAEMLKGKPWTPATLEDVGGAKGVGVTFLQECFVHRNAPPRHRLHQKAARETLRRLLPESGTDIKGGMRSEASLRIASDYDDQPQAFDELLQILTQETRLVTPVDREGSTIARAGTETHVAHNQRHYQLTHDYLVPSLRKWLDLEDGATRTGRARLRLEARTENWKTSQENRQLPVLWETMNIGLLTRRLDWTHGQRQMMYRAVRYHGIRVALTLAIVATLFLAGTLVRDRLVANGLVKGLLTAEVPQIPKLYDDLDRSQGSVQRQLLPVYDELTDEQKLKANLALVRWQKTDQLDEYLSNWLLIRANADEVPIIGDALQPPRDELVETLWSYLEQPRPGQDREQLRAASALAGFAPNSDRWSAAVCQEVGLRLVSVPSNLVGDWMDNLQPIADKLIAPLSEIFGSETVRGNSLTELQRTLAADVLADYASDRPAELTRLIADANEEQFLKLFPVFQPHGAEARSLLRDWLRRKAESEDDQTKDRLARQQANAAVATIRLDTDAQEDIWPLLRFSPDPRRRSYLIDRLSQLQVNPARLLQRLTVERETSIRTALLLSLGEYPRQQLSRTDQQLLQNTAEKWYANDPDPGVHAAARWLLVQWSLQDRIRGLDETLKRKDGELKFSRHRAPWWYINGEGQTMVIVPGPVAFEMGSPVEEAEREPDEKYHTVEIPRSFAVSAFEVTKQEFQRFYHDFAGRDFGHEQMHKYPEADCPIGGVVWHEAAQYCNWLSQQEGISESDWCYIAESNGVNLAHDYLQRRGYRLPTEAEWEYACRAGTTSPRYYGSSVALLARYGWFHDNSNDQTWPVGSLRPNEWGLFDMYGNVLEWCQDLYQSYPNGRVRDIEHEELEIATSKNRVLRSTAFFFQTADLRSANRGHYPPKDRYFSIGFRVARTISELPSRSVSMEPARTRGFVSQP